MGIVVHHLNESRSERIPWILEELGVPYQVQVHYRNGGVAPKSLKEISPLAKAPCLTIDDRLLTESGYIVHTLIDTLSSSDNKNVESPSSSSSIFWSHFSEGSFMNYLVQGRVAFFGVQAVSASSPADAAGAKKLLEFQRVYVKNGITSGLAEIEKFLQANPNFSASDKIGEGDIMLGWSLFVIAPESGKRAFPFGPATEAWVARTRARPAYKRAMARIAAEEKKQKVERAPASKM